jgi:hypothetical protein
MRKRIAVVAAVAALGAVPAAVPQAVANPAHASCKRAVIGGKHKCIARGQYCSRRYQSDYRRYGYSCSRRDRNGRYHLA